MNDNGHCKEPELDPENDALVEAHRHEQWIRNVTPENLFYLL